MFNNINLMSKALDASWKRNEVISNNIANVNTPGFKKSEVEFETLLNEFLSGRKLAGKTTHQNHIPIGTASISQLNYKVVNHNNYSTRLDGNNVDIDVEMAELAKNSITYNTLTTQLNNNIQRLKLAINEGKR